ncbi:hypothetical protein EZV62_028191 [Acer yangbiense]|uniref:Uncharacterized protein n=1 Tax=Acer yangbiense TaxID=1000413 RepID=A0A5C7GNC9_9ROSI|nr:hypothetical protein EZV62_028191 [Acer yangbiense]
MLLEINNFEINNLLNSQNPLNNQVDDYSSPQWRRTPLVSAGRFCLSKSPPGVHCSLRCSLVPIVREMEIMKVSYQSNAVGGTSNKVEDEIAVKRVQWSWKDNVDGCSVKKKNWSTLVLSTILLIFYPADLQNIRELLDVCCKCGTSMSTFHFNMNCSIFIKLTDTHLGTSLVTAATYSVDVVRVWEAGVAAGAMPVDGEVRNSLCFYSVF